MESRSRKRQVETEESSLVECIHSYGESGVESNTLIRNMVTSSGAVDQLYGSTHGAQSNTPLHNLKENGKKYKRRKRLEQSAVILAAVLISVTLAVGTALLAIHINKNDKDDPASEMDVYASTDAPLIPNTDAVKIAQQAFSNSIPALYFPNLEYAVFGYNILNAYPLAFGHDPGFTHPIFLVEYGKQKRNADLTYLVPDGLDVVRDTACDTSFSSTVIKDQSEFDKSLSVSAEVSGGGFGVKFSASTQYKKDSSVVSSKENVMMLTQAKCQQFFTQVNEFSPPPLHPSFIGWAKKLQNTTDDRDYLDFIQYYGTHILSEVAFGARFMYQFVMSTSSYKSMQSKSINVDVAASFHFLVFSGGAKFSMSDSQKQALSEFQQHVTTRTISLGTPPPMDLNATKWANQAFDNPVPISYNLLPIDQVFTDKFMGHLEVDYQRIRHRLLNIINVQYRKEVFDRSSNLQCRVVNHAVKLPESAYFQKSFEVMGRKSGPKCHGQCLETQDCLGITYSGPTMDDQVVPSDCQTMYRMSYNEKLGLLANQINHTGFQQKQQPQTKCNTYVFPYRQTSNYGLKHPSWLMVNGVEVNQMNAIGSWVTVSDLESCKNKCVEDLDCVAISSQIKGTERNCGLFNKAEVDMVTLQTSSTTSDVGFIKQCA